MTLELAKHIKELKRGCSFRRLAELIYVESDADYGDQYAGMQLCKDALKVLYPHDDIYMMYKPEEKFGPHWRKDNLSHFGDFYWWE